MPSFLSPSSSSLLSSSFGLTAVANLLKLGLPLGVANEVLDALALAPACTPMPDPNDVLRMPKPSMNIPDVVRCLGPARCGPPDPGLKPPYVGLRTGTGTAIRKPRLASGSVGESTGDSRGRVNDEEWRSRGEVMTDPNVGAGLVERGGLRKLGAQPAHFGDVDGRDGGAVAESDDSSEDESASSCSVRLIEAMSCSRSSSFCVNDCVAF